MNQAVAAANYPLYTAEEAESRETFLALMWALSYPGRICNMPRRDGAPLIADEVASFAQIGHALLDLETTFFTPDAGLAAQLKHTAARAYPVEQAAYHFYPAVTPGDLTTIEQASVGTALFPDQSATLFLGCAPGSLSEKDGGTHLSLTGPGIKSQQDVHFAGIGVELWALRQRAICPLGWDIFIVDPVGKLIGLPRTTKIAWENQE
jgi:alpha-D-ribose 1-methylphosphonate 5-triphosphate synthase subunit PhnH